MTPAAAERVARDVIDEAFEDEIVRELHVEELRLDERAGAWTITFAFVRASKRGPAAPASRRSRRTISLRDSDGALLALRRRAPHEPVEAAG